MDDISSITDKISNNNILPSDTVSSDNRWMIYAISALAFIFFSIDSVQRDPLYWIIKYSRFWVYFTLPHIAVLNALGNVTTV